MKRDYTMCSWTTTTAYAASKPIPAGYTSFLELTAHTTLQYGDPAVLFTFNATAQDDLVHSGLRVLVDGHEAMPLTWDQPQSVSMELPLKRNASQVVRWEWVSGGSVYGVANITVRTC
jgi:hypothetical protein